MGKYHIEFLSNNELDLIHNRSLDLLQNIGIKIMCEEALECFAEIGAIIDYNNYVVKLSPEIVMDYIAHAPQEFTLHAREHQFDMVLKKSGPFFGTMGGATHVLDLNSMERRIATYEDTVNIIRIIDSCENLKYVQALVTPQDVPSEKCYLYEWSALFKNTKKHIAGTVQGSKMVESIVKMGSLLTGSSKLFKKKPFVSFCILSTSPLQYDKLTVEALMAAARNNIPVYISSGPIAGITSPVTLAGTIAVAHAEVLAGIVLTQCINPGTPLMYASWARTMDMKCGNISLASPEWSIFKIVFGQLAKYINLPFLTGAMLRDAKVPDIQAGYEMGISGLAAGFGADVMLGIQLDCDTLVDFGDIVIGNEVAGMLSRIYKGFEVSEEKLAYNLITEKAFMGDYLGDSHTYNNYKDEIWQQGITERRTWGEWQKDGGKDLWEIARSKAMGIIANYNKQILPDKIEKELDEIIKLI